MDGQDLPFNQGSNGKRIERVHDQLVDFFIKFHVAFEFEVEVLSHVAALMIPAQHHNMLWVVKLKKIRGKEVLLAHRGR